MQKNSLFHLEFREFFLHNSLCQLLLIYTTKYILNEYSIQFDTEKTYFVLRFLLLESPASILIDFHGKVLYVIFACVFLAQWPPPPSTTTTATKEQHQCYSDNFSHLIIHYLYIHCSLFSNIAFFDTLGLRIIRLVIWRIWCLK